MFGYHDSNRCSFDLWAPQAYHTCEDADPVQPGYGVWESTPYRCAIDNRAFSPYAKHSQEIEDIITQIGAGALGDIETDDDLTDNDLHYIENQVRNRYGFDVVLTNN